MTAPARVKEADIMRTLRAAKRLGAKRVKVCADGSIDIVLAEDSVEALMPIPLPQDPVREGKSLW
jgi:hypothetical protein